jgi:hypothetical protein
MPSESVCQVARSWVEVGSFHTRLVIRFMIFTATVRNILDTPLYMNHNHIGSTEFGVCRTILNRIRWEDDVISGFRRGAESRGKAIPLQAWTGPEGSRRLRLPDLKTIGT